MKRTLIVAVSLLLPLNSILAVFTDVPVNNDFHQAISYVQSQDIVQGYADGSYGVNRNINRAEFTKIVITSQFSAASIAACNLNSLGFSDVPVDSWFAPFVCIAKQKNIISGYPDGSFRPSQSIAFVEAAKIIATTFDYSVITGDQWFEGFVRALSQRSAIPVQITDFGQLITRGHMAEMIYRIRAGVNNKASVSYEKIAGLPEIVSAPVASAPTNEPEPVREPAPVSEPVIIEETPIIPRSEYANGTYSQEGSYRSPGGRDTLNVTLSLESDIIKNVSIDVVSAGGTSRSYIQRFSEGIVEVVVGQNINDVTVPGRVNGSSLTKNGFNSALDAIKSEAKN